MITIIERYKEFFCGASAGCIETFVLFPKTKIIFRQQLHNISLVDAAKQIQSYNYAFLLARRSFGNKCSNPTKMISSGATEACLCPLERVQSLLQTTKHLDKFKNTGHTFRLIYRDYPLKDCSNILFFSLREPLRTSLLKLSPQPVDNNRGIFHSLADFICGGFLGGCISTLFYPINVVKNRMQSSVCAEFISSWHVLQIIMAEREGSIRALYRGAQLNFSRSVLTWGITNSVYGFLIREFFPRS
uniref:Solute carrier family 25 member 51 n=1 Tax=Meloidogyne hapla TaxID=6305 RepID=A0A1I8C1T1_MELHA